MPVLRASLEEKEKEREKEKEKEKEKEAEEEEEEEEAEGEEGQGSRPSEGRSKPGEARAFQGRISGCRFARPAD